MSQTKAQLLGPVLGDVNYDSGTLFVDSTNNRVGIGTTVPSNLLTIADNSYIAVGKTWGIDFRDSSKGSPQAFIYAYGKYDTNYNTDLIFGTIATSGSAVERLRISDVGNIGIGTTNPQSTLHIVGNQYLTGGNYFTDSTSGYFWNGAGSYSAGIFGGAAGLTTIRSSANIIIETGGTGEKLRVTSTGNVGIGITNPTYTLHTGGTAAFVTTGITTEGPFYIVGNKATAGGAVVSIRHDSVTGADDVFGGIKISSAPGADFVIGKNSRLGTGYLQIRREGGTQLLTIDGNGNVGIGTTNPISTLHVQGSFRSLLNSGTGGDTILGAINGVSNGYIINTDTSNNITHTWHTGGNVVALRISNTGNVGIGTSDNSANKVTIFDTMAKNPSSSGWGLVVTDSNTDGIAGRGGAIAFAARRTDGGNFNAGAISGAKSNSTGLNEHGDLVFWSSVNSTLTERMRIVTGGNVGIGTTNPTSKLYIKNGDLTVDTGVVGVYSSGTAPVVEQNGAVYFAMRGKVVQSYSNATAVELFTLSNLYNAGVMVKVIARGTNAVSAVMWEDTFTAWLYYLGGTYQSSGIGPSTVQNISGTHTSGALSWASVSGGTPILRYTQGANGYILETLDIFVTCRDGCNVSWNRSYVSFG